MWSVRALNNLVEDYRQSVKNYIWVNTGNAWADTAINGFSDTIVDVSTGGLAMNFALNSVDRYSQNVCELNNNKFWAATDALNLALGDIVGYTMLLEGCFGADRASLSDLSTGERWFRGVAGGVQTAFFVVGAAEGLHAVRGKFFATKQEVKVFRQGTFANKTKNWDGNYVKGKQWATDNPLTTKNYARKYGLPSENTGKPDWITSGRLNETYTIRRAPPSHNNSINSGGGLEILPENPDAVILDWFYMPD